MVIKLFEKIIGNRFNKGINIAFNSYYKIIFITASRDVCYRP